MSQCQCQLIGISQDMCRAAKIEVIWQHLFFDLQSQDRLFDGLLPERKLKEIHPFLE